MSINISKNASKNLSVKYSWKPFDHAERSTADAVKTISKRRIQNTANTTGDLIGNKITYRITKV